MHAIGMVLAAAAALAALPSTQTFESGESQAALIELYTSEGCSSCPPAETWLAHLRGSPELWKKVVPVAFHVNYWDNLGWPDRFAAPAFTQHQRDYGAAWHAGNIYTPEFVLNGREWDRSAPLPVSGNAGVLRVTLDRLGSVKISYDPKHELANAPVAELAPLAGGIVIDVLRGENAGRRITHEFVATSLLSTPMKMEGGKWVAHLALPKDDALRVTAVAAWVHGEGDATPFQAAGGWLKH